MTIVYRADYEQARAAVSAGGMVSGDAGELLDDRAEGSGGGSARTLSFYARPALVAEILDLRAFRALAGLDEAA